MHNVFLCNCGSETEVPTDTDLASQRGLPGRQLCLEVDPEATRSVIARLMVTGKN